MRAWAERSATGRQLGFSGQRTRNRTLVLLDDRVLGHERVLHRLGPGAVSRHLSSANSQVTAAEDGLDGELGLGDERLEGKRGHGAERCAVGDDACCAGEGELGASETD